MATHDALSSDELLQQAADWRAQGRQVALARVVRVWFMIPRSMVWRIHQVA